MNGSELTYAGNCFTAGYVVGQMPAVMLATRVRPSILIPTLEIIWSVLTFCSSSLTSVPQLYAIRFLVGLCEGGYFPVMIVSHFPSTPQSLVIMLTNFSILSEVGEKPLSEVHKRNTLTA